VSGKRGNPGAHGALRRAAALFAAVLPLLPGAALSADPEAGRQKAQPCVACHGPGGNSVNPAVPSIAGQPAQFISMQLFQFREGNRKDPQMTPITAGLSNADMNDLAAYFAAQKPAPPAHAADPAKAETAKRLAQQYNCVQCHGPALLGLQHIPRLAGQQYAYLKNQLLGFKASTRADLDGIMTSAAMALSAADIDILADYLAGLGAP
jgi:cytochrome c553